VPQLAATKKQRAAGITKAQAPSKTAHWRAESRKAHGKTGNVEWETTVRPQATNATKSKGKGHLRRATRGGSFTAPILTQLVSPHKHYKHRVQAKRAPQKCFDHSIASRRQQVHTPESGSRPQPPHLPGGNRPAAQTPCLCFFLAIKRPWPSYGGTETGGGHQCVVRVRERSAAEAGSARALLM
jgi:hypothetical protein